MGDTNTEMRAYLRTRYTVTNTDVQPLIMRYLAENPSALNDQTKVFTALQVAAKT
jgi:hypothetical protein